MWQTAKALERCRGKVSFRGRPAPGGWYTKVSLGPAVISRQEDQVQNCQCYCTAAALPVRQDTSAGNMSFPAGNGEDLWSRETVAVTRTPPESQTIVSLFQQVSLCSVNLP